MLEEFDVRIKYVRGDQNGAADARSRHPILVLSYVLWTWHLSFDGKQSTRQKCLNKCEKMSMGPLSQ